MRDFTFDEVWPLAELSVRRVHTELLDAISNANRLDEILVELVRDGNLWSTHVRAYLAKALQVPIDDEDEFALERGFNISLTLFSETVSLRILKAEPDKMPQPGNSLGRLEYFNQGLGQFVFDGMEEVGERTDLPECAPNFILKWSIDEFRRLVQLDLGYPKPTIREGYSDKPIAQEWFWIAPVFDLSKPVFDDLSLFEEQDLRDVERKSDEDEDEETGSDEETGTAE